MKTKDVDTDAKVKRLAELIPLENSWREALTFLEDQSEEQDDSCRVGDFMNEMPYLPSGSSGEVVECLKAFTMKKIDAIQTEIRSML